jgi:hypothetical protein
MPAGLGYCGRLSPLPVRRRRGRGAESSLSEGARDFSPLSRLECSPRGSCRLQYEEAVRPGRRDDERALRVQLTADIGEISATTPAARAALRVDAAAESSPTVMPSFGSNRINHLYCTYVLHRRPARHGGEGEQDFEFPAGRITVSLARADLSKEGGRFDLPIALGILLASGQIRAPTGSWEAAC